MTDDIKPVKYRIELCAGGKTVRKKRCPECGEDDPAKWYGPKSRSILCIACTSKYNKKHYQTQKAQTSALKKSHKRVGNIRCIECLDMSVDTPRAFASFCGARRTHKKIGGYHTNCNDCGLGEKVDGGFMPVNISVMEEVQFLR